MRDPTRGTLTERNLRRKPGGADEPINLRTLDAHQSLNVAEPEQGDPAHERNVFKAQLPLRQRWAVPYQPRTAFTVGANNRSCVGPDLAWLPLAHQHAQSLQRNARTRAVFYNLTTRLQIHDAYERYRQTVKLGDANEHLSREVHMIVGWNREIQARDGGRRGGIWMNEVVPETMSAAEGWTYRDYRINDDRWAEQSYGDGTKLPKTWGGLSGGAIWIVWRPDPAVDRYEKILAGVVFYESPQWGQRTRTIRTHYDLSLIRLLHRAGIAPQYVINEEDIAKANRNLPLPERWEE